MKEKISITLNSKTIRAVDSIVDRLYVQNRSQAIEHLIDKALGEDKVAVIFAGGDEKNLIFSKDEYRPTARIKNQRVIELAIKKLRENGFRNVFILARALILRDIFNLLGDGSKYGVKVTYIKETESRGSADSLRLLKGKIRTSFLVVFCDLIFNKINLKELWETHLRQKSIATLVVGSSPLRWTKAGIVKMNGNKIVEFEEKPSKSESTLYFSGMLVAEPEIFEHPGASLEREIFPKLAETGFLSGYITSTVHFHFHTKKELKEIEQEIGVV